MMRELGIGITAYGVLSRGLISGHWSKVTLAAGDFERPHRPRVQRENLDHNLELVENSARHRRREGYHCRTARHRLGSGEGRGYRSAGRRAPVRPAHRGAAARSKSC